MNDFKQKDRLASRAFSIKTSIRTRMLQIASELDEVIPLGRGDPDFDSPSTIVEAGIEALEGGLHHYTGPAGMPELRESIAAKLASDNNLHYSSENIVVTNGCQEALFISILTLVNPGDEVILQAPRFESFDHMVRIAGGTIVSVPTFEEHDYALQASAVREVITDKTKLIVIANPNNPTGSLISRDELDKLVRLVIENDLLVISDEIYEKIIFDDFEHHSLAEFDGMMDRTVTVNGFSKSYAMTGWRVGYIAAPEWLIESAVEIKHSISICTPPAMQKGALAALHNAKDDYPAGGMYVYTNVSNTGLNAEEFCMRLLRETGVMIFPGTLFGDPGNRHVRITLLSPQSIISKALERMKDFVNNL